MLRRPLFSGRQNSSTSPNPPTMKVSIDNCFSYKTRRIRFSKGTRRPVHISKSVLSGTVRCPFLLCFCVVPREVRKAATSGTQTPPHAGPPGAEKEGTFAQKRKGKLETC